MSRHRDVRSMNYSEEYEGYDDVYGHSVEDDYCVSPSVEQFLFDRSKQQNMASFITEPDIVEDNEDVVESTPKEEETILTELEKAKLISCMESIKNIIGDTAPDFEIKKRIIQSNFNAEVALDLLLKESSPKNVTESPAISKDNTEHYPDAASVKSQSSSFIIPKLSFKKLNNISTTLNASVPENLESFNNFTLTNPPVTILSSTELINNHTKSTSSKIMQEFQTNSNTPPFKSLADLTAHHLQQSSSLINTTNSNEQTVTWPSTNFVIPKLSIKKDSCNDLNNIKLNMSAVQKNISIVSETVDDNKKDYSMDSLEKSISNVLAFSENYVNNKNNLRNLETKEDSLLNVSGTRTPSPDDWMIDLSSALKEVTVLTDNSNYNPSTKSKILKNIDIIPDSKLHTFNQNVEIPYVILPTTLNSSFLKNTKLPYVERNISLFARTLCRTWKSKKPILKSQEERHQDIKRFDFSVPYNLNKQNLV